MDKVFNFGCRLNGFESEQIAYLLEETGRDDLLVVNSCAVTNETERKVRQKVRQLARDNPDKTIAVVGCSAQLHPEQYAAMSGVSLVLGNDEKLSAGSYRPEGNAPPIRTASNGKKSLHIHELKAETQKSRGQVMIQTGCDHDCTFCAITTARGDSRSVPIHEVVDYVQKLCTQDISEVVLTGVDISAYGADLPEPVTLGNLVAEILHHVPELPRLRFSSIDCIELDEQLKELIVSEPRIMPHLHLSLQSGDDMILKRMKRRHNRDQAIALCRELRAKRPEMIFGADLIAGFPTETPEMFANTLDLIADCGLTFLHVFPFSARDGTPAARIPTQIPMQERKRRAKALRLKGEEARTKLYSSLKDTVQEIVLEYHNYGRTPHSIPVRLNTPLETDQGVVQVRITGWDADYLHGEALPVAGASA